MAVYKSKINYSLTTLMALHVCWMFILGVLILFFNPTAFTAFRFSYSLLLFPHAMAIYAYAGLFNNDVIVCETGIQMVNRVPLFKKTTRFEFSSIQSISLRHDWTETFGTNIRIPWIKVIAKELALLFFPWDYKWIKIVADKEYTFYCFGIEYDYFDNEMPYFEDLFLELKKRHAHVRWTNNTSSYYKMFADDSKS